MTLIKALGIDLRILAAQFFNFAILVFVLWRFAYRPLFNILEERRRKIDKGMKDVDEAAQKLSAATEESQKSLTAAKKEALGIIEESKKQAEKRYQEIIGKSREDISVIINAEKAKIQTEKAETLWEMKKEMADLIVLSLEKVLGEKINVTQDRELIEKVIKGLK